MTATTLTEYGIRRASGDVRWPDSDGEVIVSGRWFAALDLDPERRERLREAAEAAGWDLLVRTVTTQVETTTTTSEPSVVKPPAPPIDSLLPGTFVRKPNNSVWLRTPDTDSTPWRKVHEGDGTDGYLLWNSSERLQSAGASVVPLGLLGAALNGQLR
jgi:hypothetical protein